MSHTIAVIAPGAMGSAIARILRDNGARVLTALAGRSSATAARADAAGMIDASDDRIAAEAQILLSIVPPGEALALAKRFGKIVADAKTRPLFVDCNAVSPDTVKTVLARYGTDADVVDGCIIGLPPKQGGKSPTFYLSGPAAPRAGLLADLGLTTRIMPAPVGAASALKMSYAGITKGLTAISAAMVLAASRWGSLEALRDELEASQSGLLTRLESALPDMLPKAYRWVAEMNEIADFIGADYPEHDVFRAAALLYGRIAEGDNGERGVLTAFSTNKTA